MKIILKIIFIVKITLYFISIVHGSDSQYQKHNLLNVVNSKLDSFNGQSVLERCIIHGVVALTFDDGPYYQTEQVLDVLQELDVKATFFVNGANYMNIDNANATRIIQRTIDEGHEIASHTWSHRNLTDGLQIEDVEFQLNRLSDKLFEKFGKRTKVMRPPFGEFNDTVIDIVKNHLDYSIIMWSIDTWDWSHPGDFEAGLQEYYENLNGTDPEKTLGFISLHHDPISYSDEFAAIVIQYIRRTGYRFVTLSDCLGLPI